MAGAGVSLFRRTWTTPDPVRAILLVHGFGEHSGRYEHVGSWFATHGSAVHAYDHRGQGQSEGPRCHLRRWSDYLDDCAAMLEGLRADHPGLPVFLVGHSMGGLVITSFARERRPDVLGIVTSGAALALPDAASPARLLGARALSLIAPRLSMASGIDPEGICTDPEVVKAYVADPLVESRLTVSMAAEMFGAVARTAPGGADVALPLLALHGSDDPLCAASGSEAFAKAAPRGQYRAYPGMRHEIFNEPDRQKVLEDVLTWMRALEAASGAAESGTT